MAPGPATNRFYSALYVDGVSPESWYSDPPLAVNGIAWVKDYSIGSLSAGTHTIRITVDSTGVIAESNEDDNSYTKTFAVSPPNTPNLTPYQPGGWSDKIVVSRTPGTTSDSAGLTAADTLYVDWAVINNGTGSATNRFDTTLYIDGLPQKPWYTDPPLAVNGIAWVKDYSIGSLRPGTHTIRIATDSTGTIAEGNEGDNNYTKTLNVGLGNGMVLIPAGSFMMGDCMSDEISDDNVNEFPLHSVYVSAFYMDQYLVTKALWDQVYQWAVNHGYSFESPGSGKAANHPVQTVHWFDAVKWCNARSEKEGRTPAYYTDATLTAVYRAGETHVQNDWVKWDAGYRLPTEAEWQKAARGGASGHRFP